MLKLFLEKPQSRIGLDISPEGVTLAHLIKEKDNIIVKNQIHRSTELSGTIPEALKSALQECRPDELNAAISVPGSAVFVKRITLPDLPEEELKAIAPQEASKHLPLSIKELNVDFQVLENTRRQDETGKKVDVILCAISRAVAKEFVDPVFDAGLGADMMDVSSFAVIRALAHEQLINDPQKYYISVLIGYENTDINVVQNGMPVFSYNVQTGRKNIVESIMNSTHKKREEVINMLPEVAIVVPGMDMNENPDLNQAANAAKTVYSTIAGEAQKTIEFFTSGNSEPINIEKVIISGNGACVQNIDKYMSNKLRTEAVVFNPFFSTSIGLALKGFEN